MDYNRIICGNKLCAYKQTENMDMTNLMEGVQMNEQVKEYIDKYPNDVIEMFHKLRQIILECVSDEPKEKLWAQQPSYYVGESFVRLIPFKDHINIEAQAVIQHKEELCGYKITPKGMVQIFIKQDIPDDVLKQVFTETLQNFEFS